MKTVLLFVHEDPGQEARLQAALDLVRSLGGHLKCVDVTPIPAFAGDYDGGAAGLILVEERKIEAANRAALQLRLANEDAPWDWIDSMGYMADCVVHEAGLADLVVVNCKRDTFLDLDPRGIVTATVLSARCPVVAVPDDARGFDAGGHALVAWDGSEPVMATLRAAVPLLRLAGSVTLFTVDDGGKGVPAEAAAAYLSRHGVHAAIERVPARDTRADKVILEACANQGASYCLMGAYSHGRAREDLFGGVTRGMLDAARLPLVLGS
ncbi:universal stress protein UspA [Caulobacter sp. Root1455]|uniref:universal stress protein n=1 Tax=unclassified Caulobacter TaxID=2648921 RepID=UPI0006FF4E59|nr:MULTISPECIES: universal stress protein [unclassified Caulobacter]KQY30379.1 universal stress protein UspA [Caulobacter sp. Root487D2Y]KQY92837.1 universal stress protein UspA [Caulobacter sp. Root1455]